MSETMKIPVEWKSIELGDVLNIGTGSKNAEDSSLDGVYPFFTRAENTQKIDNYSYDTEALFIAGEGNFRVKYYKGKFEAHQRTYVLTSKDEDIDLSYLQKAIQPKITKLISTSVGSTVMSLRKPQIAEIEILIPKSKLEQQKIAEILTQMDEAISKVEELFEKNNRLKTALMQDLLNYGIDEKGKIRSPQTHKFKPLKLSNIPEEWNSNILKKVCKVRQGLQIAIEQRFKESGNNRYVYITVQYLNNKEANEEFIQSPDQDLICNKDDILFTRTGNTGQIITGVHGVFHNNFFRVNINKDILNKDFMVYFLNYEITQQKIRDLAATTTIPDLKHSDFYSLRINFPKSKIEQQKIAQILSSQDEKIEDIKNKLNKLKSLKASLMQDLLSGKKRVTKLMESN